MTVIAGLYILLWGKNKEMQNCVAKVSQETEEIKDQEPSSQVDTIIVVGDSRHFWLVSSTQNWSGSSVERCETYFVFQAQL